MAKQSKILPARRQEDEESLLIRSAESLGRIIGSLQRQLEGAGARLSDTADYAMESLPRESANGAGRTRTAKRPTASVKPSRTGAGKAAGRRESGAAKAQSTTDRKSKRAAKSAPAKKSAGGRSGARKAARKTTRGG